TQTLETYLRKERITYEIYQEERKIINVGKRKYHDDALLSNKKQKPLEGK
ncbi:6964_t:CDS:1, partial [Gigaspora rosea]